MKKHFFGFLAIVSLFLLAWWGGYSLGGGENGQAVLSPEHIEREVFEARHSEGSEIVATAPAREFGLSGWRIDARDANPRACINFTNEVADTSNISDYFRLMPETRIAAKVEGRTVCLAGLSYEKSYALTIKSGLKSKNGAQLKSDQSVELEFGDRPPHVSFIGDGVIVPRTGTETVGIRTVNVERLDVKIYRVSDRMMARRRMQAGRATEEGRYSYSYEDAGRQIRSEIWSGSFDIEPSPNNPVTTALSLQKLTGEQKPGAYIVSATRAGTENNRAAAWRWLIVTDIAMTSYRARSGLHVTARSITSAVPIAGVRLDLVASNNEVLASAVTNRNGHVYFSGELINGRVPQDPKIVMAYGADGDYAVLDIQRGPLDLSEFAVSGRDAPRGIDGYVFTERGIYRPGETVHLTAMLRGRSAAAVSDRKGWLYINKPNGLEFRKLRVETLRAGTFEQAINLPANAPRGRWLASIQLDGEDEPAGDVRFAVEDFAPQKLRVQMRADRDTPVKMDERRNFEVDAQFLYGAPGSELEAEAKMRIRKDPNPFPKHTGYHFGDVSEPFAEKLKDLGTARTNEKGVADFGFLLRSQSYQTSHPLRANIAAAVSEPGGRFVRTSEKMAVRSHDRYLGIRPAFNRRAERKRPAKFSVIAVNALGEQIELGGANWALVREEWDYQWFRRGNSGWQYRRESRDVPVATGIVSIGRKPAQISQTLDWGQYRVTVTGADSAPAAYRFSVGWGASSMSDAPDEITVSGPDRPTKPGKTATVSVNAPYAGIGELVIANDKILSVRRVEIKEGGNEFKIATDAEWGEGVYALLTAYMPRANSAAPIPRRAAGVGYIALDTKNRTLGVSIRAPQKTRPRQGQAVTVKVDNVPRGNTAYVTLAAIDEGVLQITKYSDPDPAAYFYGKKAFALDVHDDYARLLNPENGRAAIARSGGDSIGGEGLTSTPIKVVALYKTAIAVKNGAANFELELPDFNGELRLMAVAWSENAVGSSSAPMIVRDSVPADLALPRFLAPGDRAFATLSLDNVEGANGRYTGSVQTGGLVSAPDNPQEYQLPKGERQAAQFTLIADQTGTETITMSANGPDGYDVSSQYGIEVRSPHRPVSRMKTVRLGGGDEFKLPADLFAGLDPKTTDVSVTFAHIPNLDPAAYAAAVTQYPYGCTEQLVSSSTPLLLAGAIGETPKINKAAARARLQAAVDKIQARQGNDGTFGLWRAGDGYGRPWMGVYAADFIWQAQQAGFAINDASMQLTFKGLRQMTDMPNYPYSNYRWRYQNEKRAQRKVRQAEAAAYAHFVLARAGQGSLPKMRYFAKTHAPSMRSPLAFGYLAAALNMMGDGYRAAIFSKMAVAKLGYSDRRDYYQSVLRDAAGVMAIAEVAGMDNDQIQSVESAFSSALKPPSRLHTQEQAHVLRAIAKMVKGADPLSVNATGADISPRAGRLVSSMAVNKATGARFTNKGAAPIWATVNISGMPIEAPPAAENGYRLSKSIFMPGGKPADLTKIRQGETLIVRVRFASKTGQTRQTVLADLLPAGMEIESILTSADGKKRNGDGAFAWLGEISEFQLAEKRDDRFVAAIETESRDSFTAAYIVRAVTQGDFIWPGASAEDMYRPGDQSRTQPNRVQIGPGFEG